MGWASDDGGRARKRPAGRRACKRPAGNTPPRRGMFAPWEGAKVPPGPAGAAGGTIARSVTSPQSSLERLAKLVDPERALEPGHDHALLVDREQPRLGLQVERLHLGAKALIGLVADVDLLVDEGDLVAELLLQRHGDVGHRPADLRDAQLGCREQQ